MAALNEGYEVLSNPELRGRIDRGEDPMDQWLDREDTHSRRDSILLRSPSSSGVGWDRGMGTGVPFPF